MNPILNCPTLMKYGRAVFELGPQWDSRTCLVVSILQPFLYVVLEFIACSDNLTDGSFYDKQLVASALGAITSPFSPFADTVESLSTSSSRQDGHALRQKAESYYEYARRRFGLLGIDLTSCHCHFLSGVYLLWTLRPIEAWQAFSQASSLYTLYLKILAARRLTQIRDASDSEAVPDEHDCHENLRQCLEQRLYWSCIKSEKLVQRHLSQQRSVIITT